LLLDRAEVLYYFLLMIFEGLFAAFWAFGIFLWFFCTLKFSKFLLFCCLNFSKIMLLWVFCLRIMLCWFIPNELCEVLKFFDPKMMLCWFIPNELYNVAGAAKQTLVSFWV
jgi:hypothetical protein